MDYLFASHHKGPRFKSPGGYLCETGILLLVLSRYNIMFKIFSEVRSSDSKLSRILSWVVLKVQPFLVELFEVESYFKLGIFRS